jgi:hypothetical protein
MRKTNMSDHRNNVPPLADVNGKVWIQLHSTTSGVTLAGGDLIDPGETKLVHESTAQQLVLSDRARYAEPPRAA